MPFLGKSPSDGNHNVLLDAITTSATATYNLTKDSVAYTPVSAQSLMVSLNGVTQAPIAAYTVSGSTIVFASALTSNDVIDYIICFEGPKVTATLDDNTVTTAMIQDNAITSAKIGVDVIVAEDLAANSITVSELTDGAITEAKLNIDNTPTNDHVLTAKSSAAGGLTWAAAAIAGITSSADATAMTIDSSERIVMPSQPMFYATTINAVSGGSLVTGVTGIYNAAGGSATDYAGMSFAKIWSNIGSHWNNSTGQFTCPIAGRYLAFWNNNYHGNSSWPNSHIMHSVDGGSTYPVAMSWMSDLDSAYTPLPVIAIINAAASDKIWPAYRTGSDAPTVTTTFGYNACGIMLLG
jgi:hypothetical protein